MTTPNQEDDDRIILTPDHEEEMENDWVPDVFYDDVAESFLEGFFD